MLIVVIAALLIYGIVEQPIITASVICLVVAIGFIGFLLQLKQGFEELED